MTDKSRILIIGATGQNGKLIANLLKNNSSIELLVATRKREILDDLAKQYGQAVYLDLNDPLTFANALQGVDRLFLLTGYTVAMLAQSKTLIDAAITADVNYVVHLGVFSKAWNCTVPHFIWHQMIETYIKATSLQWTFLHPNCFLQNLISYSVLSNKQLTWYTSKPCGWIALEDVAETAAKILLEGPKEHHAEDYWFSTESLTIMQVAQILSQVTQLQISPKPRSANLFIEDMGIDPRILDPYFFSVAQACEQIEDGRMSYIGDVTDDIQKLLQRKGTALQDWAKQHKAELIALANQKGAEKMQWGA
jgi:NAD(P)H dehydrogenase (quinone)